jgi:membrane associated rhomboid family serine protease
MFDSIWNDIKGTFNQQKNVVPKLILANIIVFVLLNGSKLSLTFLLSRLFGFEAYRVLNFFSLPIHIEELVWKPWTLFTYGFLHDGFWHIFFNMIFLYVFGNILQEYLGNKKILTLFFAGIIISALGETIAYQVLRFTINSYPDGHTIGASGAVMAVMAATATLLPDYKLRVIIFDIRLKYIFLFYFLSDLLSLANESNWGGHMAHLTGAIFGYLYIKDIYSKSYVDGLVENIQNLFKPKTKLKVTYRKDNYKGSTAASNNKRHYQKPNQQEIDDILDKISQSGYDSLTKNEKELLFAASNDD